MMTWQGSPRADTGELATFLDKLQSVRNLVNLVVLTGSS